MPDPDQADQTEEQLLQARCRIVPWKLEYSILYYTIHYTIL